MEVLVESCLIEPLPRTNSFGYVLKWFSRNGDVKCYKCIVRDELTYCHIAQRLIVADDDEVNRVTSSVCRSTDMLNAL